MVKKKFERRGRSKEEKCPEPKAGDDIDSIRMAVAKTTDLEELFRSIGVSVSAVLKEKALPTGGPGGQNANKRSTSFRATVSLGALPSALAVRLREKCPGKYLGEKNDTLFANCGDYRSQLQNRVKAKQQIFEMIQQALEEQEERKEEVPKEVKRKKKATSKRTQQHDKRKREGRKGGRHLRDH